MGKQVFVVTNVAAINTKATRDLLTDGEIGIYAMDAATLKTVRAQTSTVAEFFSIALGRGIGPLGNQLKPDSTGRIDVSPVKDRRFDWFKAAYVAPVLPQIQVTTTCLGTSEYDDFLLRVSTRFGGDLSGQEYNVKTYPVSGKQVDATTFYANAAAAVNADEDADVTATSSAAGVVITPKRVGALVEVGFEFVDNQYKQNCMTCDTCNSVVTKLNEPFDGEGTYAKLMQHIKEARGYRGTIYTDSREVPLPSDQYTGLSTSSTWDFYILTEKNKDQAKGDPGQVFDIFQTYIIAVAAGTNFAAFTQVIDALVGTPLRTAIV